MSQWYFAVDGQQSGPHDDLAALEFARSHPAAHAWRPGFADWKPVGEIADAVLVREDAIGTDLGGKYVLVVGDDNVVELRHIELGPLQEDGTRVVLSGLEAAERYIVNGLQRARPGLPVTPTMGN